MDILKYKIRNWYSSNQSNSELIKMVADLSELLPEPYYRSMGDLIGVTGLNPWLLPKEALNCLMKWQTDQENERKAQLKLSIEKMDQEEGS